MFALIEMSLSWQSGKDVTEEPDYSTASLRKAVYRQFIL
jgi:hypothetical protein